MAVGFVPASRHSMGAPVSAHSLPEIAFSSLAYQAMENVAIWSRLWVCIGFAAEIPDAGDVLPMTVGNQGIHVERMNDGSLVGRFNKAQHGGCRSVPLQCRTGTKTRCSFTACGYSRDRRPIRASDPDRASHLDQYLGLRPERLLPVAVATRGPLLLVNVDPGDDAVPCWATTVSAGSSLDDLRSLSETSWREVPGNWKAVAIRFADCGEGVAELLFPNVIVRKAGAHTVVVVLQPVALDRTLCRMRVFGGNGLQAEGTTARAVLDTMARELDFAAVDTEASSIRNTAFEGAVASALDVLSTEPATGRLFRTDEKGSW